MKVPLRLIWQGGKECDLRSRGKTVMSSPALESSSREGFFESGGEVTWNNDEGKKTALDGVGDNDRDQPGGKTGGTWPLVQRGKVEFLSGEAEVNRCLVFGNTTPALADLDSATPL